MKTSNEFKQILNKFWKKDHKMFFFVNNIAQEGRVNECPGGNPIKEIQS